MLLATVLTRKTFDCERLKFVLTLLTSGYPLSFVDYHFKRFFCVNQALPVWKLLDVTCYQRLHVRLLNQPTRQEKKRRQLSDNIDGQATYLPVKKSWDRTKLIVHYHFESGPTAHYRQEFRRLWQSYYVHDQSRVKDVRLIVGTSLGEEKACSSVASEWVVDRASSRQHFNFNDKWNRTHNS